MSETDARREAVAEIVHAALDFNMLVNTILAWHDAETRALREALERLREWHGRKCGSGTECKVYKDVAHLLTPTPGAGKEIQQ